MKTYCAQCPEIDLSKPHKRYTDTFYWCNKFSRWRLAHDECLNERVEPLPKEVEVIPTPIKKIIKKLRKKKKVPKPEPPIQALPEEPYVEPAVPPAIIPETFDVEIPAPPEIPPLTEKEQRILKITAELKALEEDF